MARRTVIKSKRHTANLNSVITRNCTEIPSDGACKRTAGIKMRNKTEYETSGIATERDENQSNLIRANFPRTFLRSSIYMGECGFP